MAFKYACFLSYRHSEQELGRAFIEQLCAGLAGEIEQYGRQVYRDVERLKGGQFYNEALASELCHSACMILVFAPNYFDADHPYCAREFRAMEILEQQRLSLLPPAQRESGVIVPIVLRGRKHLPDHIGKKRQYWDFSDFTLAEGDLRKSPAYAKALVEIAAYVEERVREIEAANADPCACCHGFSLPSASDVAALIASAARPPAFPLRETSP